MAAFGDLFIVQQNGPRETENLISKAAKLGYETIAVSFTFVLKKAAKGKEKAQCPEATKWGEMAGIQNLKRQHRKLKVLSRLTVPLEENSQIHQLASDAVLGYDILAVRPLTEKFFQQACSALEVDIISLDLTSRLPFYIKMPQVRQAIERGISFEIVYSPAIRDSTQRKYIISNALELVRAARGRKIVISSEAENIMDLRGPYDIANLGQLFGLKEEQAKATVSKNIRAVLYHAEARRGTGRSTVTGCPISSLDGGELWKIGLQKNDDEDNSDEDQYSDDGDDVLDSDDDDEEDIGPKRKKPKSS